MSDSYKKVNAGRLTFKGGDLATRSKSIDKKHKKTNIKKKTLKIPNDAVLDDSAALVNGEEIGAKSAAAAAEEEDVYTIDAAKKMKYDELFPVEAKKFGYDPKEKKKSVEEALDDRVKKKADRYCK